MHRRTALIGEFHRQVRRWRSYGTTNSPGETDRDRAGNARAMGTPTQECAGLGLALSDRARIRGGGHEPGDRLAAGMPSDHGGQVAPPLRPEASGWAAG